MKTAALYARISKENQSEYSLPTQLDGSRQYAVQKLGCTVVHEEVDEFTGTVLDRPAFDRLKALAGKVDVVVVYVQDRLSRSDPLDTWNEVRYFNSRGTEVHAVDTGLIVADDLISSLP